MEDQDKTCETCKHFYRHYVHWVGKRFKPLDMGHWPATGMPRAGKRRRSKQRTFFLTAAISRL